MHFFQGDIDFCQIKAVQLPQLHDYALCVNSAQLFKMFLNFTDIMVGGLVKKRMELQDFSKDPKP